MKTKKILAMIAISIIMVGTQAYKLWANPGSADIITDKERMFAPVNSIIQQMGGQVERNEADRYTILKINGKSIRIDDTWAFAEIDGKYTPYETIVVNDWRVPTPQKPIVKGGSSYVPVEFLKAKLGLDLQVANNQVTFQTPTGQTEVAVVETPNTPNNEKVVEHNSVVDKPSNSNKDNASKTPSKPNNSGNTSGGSNNTKPNTPPPPSKVPDTTPPPSKPQPTKIYTGSQVKQKLYDLGFVNKNNGLKLNPYGANGLVEYDYMRFNVLSGDKDMYLIICYSNPEVDKKIRTIFDYILPTQGGKLYSILDNPNVQSQTVELDGRKISIEVGNDGIRLRFSPIIK